MTTTHQSLTRALLTGMVGVALIGGLVAGCQLFDKNSSSLTAPTAETGRLENFIVADAESTQWGGQYAEGNAYFMVNIPVAGAVKVEYTVAGGGTFAIFADLTAPTTWEIGLTAADGVPATVERVCVTYTEGAAFASVPAEADANALMQATHYLRTLEDGSAENWWPSDAAFKFVGKTTTVCVVVDGKVQGAEVSGPFPKPQPTPVPATTTATSTGFACPSGWTDPNDSITRCVQNGSLDCFNPPVTCPAISGYTTIGSTSTCSWIAKLSGNYMRCLYSKLP